MAFGDLGDFGDFGDLGDLGEGERRGDVFLAAGFSEATFFWAGAFAASHATRVLTYACFSSSCMSSNFCKDSTVMPETSG